uniref:ATP synthase F0 subunit 6 n=1 Tax=Rufoboletus hainanensis TaxID=1968705 RepID=UPI0028D44A49|nr:ATP synthase F0 subunit 6 [Butyriboletus hainanensis]WMX20508.1 ATP synthase F0 subunit 6 [Butyriboletus hainanensis]
MFLNNLNNLFINSPLEQFEVVSLASYNSPLLFNTSLTLTNSALFTVLVISLILFIHQNSGKNKTSLNFNKKMNLIPNKESILLESLFSSINTIVRDQIGREIYLPFIYSLFLFILCSNLVGNIPYTFTITTSIILSMGLSFTILIGVTILGLSIHKIHFFSLFIPSGTPLALVPLLVLIELISYLARAFSLGIRLFANMVAGHTLLKILSTFLFKMFSSGLIIFVLTLLPFALFLAITVLELAVSFIQAYVFVLLVCSYIKDAIELH